MKFPDEFPSAEVMGRWAEECRNLYEQDQKYLTVTALLYWSNYYAPPEYNLEANRALKQFYFDEICAEWAYYCAGARAGESYRPQVVTVTNEDGTVTQQTVGKAQTTGSRYTGKWLGHPATAILRWMGKNGWSVQEAKAAAKKAGQELADSTVSIQVRAGKVGDTQRGPVPDLTKEQAKELEALKS